MFSRIVPFAATLSLSVALLMIGCSLSGLTAQTLTASQASPKRITAGAPQVAEWEVGAAVTFENLTIFPVTAVSWPDTDQFTTLDAGLKSGQVKITEMVGEGQQGEGQSVQQQSHAEINRLSLANHSGKPLLLLAGEMLLGGQQDRIDASDRIVQPAQKPMPLAVFCVEPGRWNGAEQFGLTARAERLAGAQAGPASAGGSGTAAGVGAGTGTGVGPGVASTNGGGLATGTGSGRGSARTSAGAIDTRVVTGPSADGTVAGMANAKVREKAEVSKDQAQVWQSVNLTARSNMVVTESGSLQHVYDDKKVSDHLNRYIRAFKEKLTARNIVGVVVAVNGKVQLADVFASPSLFQAYWPKLLKSYALEAQGSGKGKGPSVPLADARRFLSAVEGDTSYENEDGAYRLVRHSSQEGDSSFALEYTGSGTPMLVHFNRISNK